MLLLFVIVLVVVCYAVLSCVCGHVFLFLVFVCSGGYVVLFVRYCVMLCVVCVAFVVVVVLVLVCVCWCVSCV